LNTYSLYDKLWVEKEHVKINTLFVVIKVYSAVYLLHGNLPYRKKKDQENERKADSLVLVIKMRA
jgi:hypothetical protein